MYNQSTTGKVSRTLKCPKGGDDIPCVVAFEPGIASRDGGHVYEGVSGTLRATMVMQKVICLQGNGIDRADTTGCNGKGWTEDVSYTLNTIDRHAVACCMETFHCNTEEEKKPPIKARNHKDPLVICYEKTKK